MAYNAVQQTARALMLRDGYRPRGAEQHATVLEYLRERLGSEYPMKFRFSIRCDVKGIV
jgi:hypothetical protein